MKTDLVVYPKKLPQVFFLGVGLSLVLISFGEVAVHYLEYRAGHSVELNIGLHLTFWVGGLCVLFMLFRLIDWRPTFRITPEKIFYCTNFYLPAKQVNWLDVKTLKKEKSLQGEVLELTFTEGQKQKLFHRELLTHSVDEMVDFVDKNRFIHD